jgi:hypothetical protein
MAYYARGFEGQGGSMKSYLILAHLLTSLSAASMDPQLPRPFKVNSQPQPTSEHFKVAQRCHISAEVVKKNEKLFVRVKLYYRNLSIMQNEYELDIERLAKL